VTETSAYYGIARIISELGCIDFLMYRGTKLELSCFFILKSTSGGMMDGENTLSHNNNLATILHTLALSN